MYAFIDQIEVWGKKKVEKGKKEIIVASIQISIRLISNEEKRKKGNKDAMFIVGLDLFYSL